METLINSINEYLDVRAELVNQIGEEKTRAIEQFLHASDAMFPTRESCIRYIASRLHELLQDT